MQEFYITLSITYGREIEASMLNHTIKVVITELAASIDRVFLIITQQDQRIMFKIETSGERRFNRYRMSFD